MNERRVLGFMVCVHEIRDLFILSVLCAAPSFLRTSWLAVAFVVVAAAAVVFNEMSIAAGRYPL